jgi:hypothetical protein
MAIGFRRKTVKESRAELAKMTDAELIELGKKLRECCRPQSGQTRDKDWWKQLQEARAEWRRRHPPKTLHDLE